MKDMFIIFLLYNIYAFKRNKSYSGKLAIGGLSTKIIATIGILLLFLSLLGALDFIGSNYKTNYLALLFVLFMVNAYFFIRLIYFTVRKN